MFPTCANSAGTPPKTKQYKTRAKDNEAHKNPVAKWNKFPIEKTPKAESGIESGTDLKIEP